MTATGLDVVVAFIQPFELDGVVDALRRRSRFPGMSVSEVRGFGAHAAHPPTAGDATEVNPFKKKVRVEICCVRADTDAIVDTIRQAAHTGNPGDGKVFVYPVTLACRIRTGETGEAAVRARGHAAPPPDEDQ